MKNHLHTSKGMPSAKGMIILRVPYGRNKKLLTYENVIHLIKNYGTK